MPKFASFALHRSRGCPTGQSMPTAPNTCHFSARQARLFVFAIHIGRAWRSKSPMLPQTILNNMTFRMSPLICILFLPFGFFVSDVRSRYVALGGAFLKQEMHRPDPQLQERRVESSSRLGESMVKPEISPSRQSHEVDIFSTRSNRWSNEHSVSFTNSVVFAGLQPCLAKVFCGSVLHTLVVILPTSYYLNWIKIDISEAYRRTPINRRILSEI